MMQEPIRILLGLGTNLGDKKKNLMDAIRLLGLAGLDVLSVSSFYSSPAWGITDQDDFINIAALVETRHSASDLLGLVLDCENQMGRVREKKWGPRIIDIDILDYGGQIQDWPGLQLPHPWLTQRAFVLLPLCEIVPDWIPPGHSKAVEQLWGELSSADRAGTQKMDVFTF